MKLKEFVSKYSWAEMSANNWCIGNYRDCKVMSLQIGKAGWILSTDKNIFYAENGNLNVAEFIDERFRLTCDDISCDVCPLKNLTKCNKSDYIIDNLTDLFRKLEKQYGDETTCLLKRDAMLKLIKLEQEYKK